MDKLLMLIIALFVMYYITVFLHLMGAIKLSNKQEFTFKILLPFYLWRKNV